MNRAMCFRLVIRGLIVLIVLCTATMASAEWTENVLYSFQGGKTDGALPVGKIVFDSAGNLYGATTQGGGEYPPAQCGTVFELTPPTQKGNPWTETVLYIFKGNASGDGNLPAGGLVMDSQGNLYGTTGYGGTGSCVLLGTKVGCGTVYELSPPSQQGGSWAETVLYSFQSGKDGYLPQGDLVADKNGNLYGATEYGGGYGSCNSPYYQYCGTVFELSPSKKRGGTWEEQVLYSFKGATDGANPNGGLIFDKKGATYGTTYSGGNQNCKLDGSVGCGTAFVLNPPGPKGGPWKENLLHVFKDYSDGALPSAGLTLATNGELYGTTLSDVFRLREKSGSWRKQTIYTFTNYAWGPQGTLIFDKTGNLYDTTYSAQSYAGTVFQLKAPGRKRGKWTFNLLYGFTGGADGGEPAAGLVPRPSGHFYSTTTKGGGGNCSFYGCGTVFEASP